MTKLHKTRSATLGLVLAVAVTLPLIGACTTHVHPAPRAHSHGAVRVAVVKGHIHSARCGHYRHRGHWYHVRGHHHGPRCGHSLLSGVWVLRR